MVDVPADNWFVAQLKPQGLRRAEENLARQGIQSFCPKRLEGTISGGKRVSKHRPLFPGYLFVRVDAERPVWTSLNATRGISRMILTDIRNPRPLPEPFMAGLMARCDLAGVIGSPPELSAGDTIRILSGPFADTVARIETLEDDARIQLLLSLMGREVRTSAAASQVEKL